MQQKLPLILIIAGVLILGIAFAVEANSHPGGYSGLFKGLYNGRETTCSATINARLLDGRLDIVSASCSAGEPCFVSPARAFSIIGWATGTDRSGTLKLTQSGETYDSTSVTRNILGSASPAQLSACLPSAASQARIVMENQDGGIDDEITTNIQ